MDFSDFNQEILFFPVKIGNKTYVNLSLDNPEINPNYLSPDTNSDQTFPDQITKSYLEDNPINYPTEWNFVPTDFNNNLSMSPTLPIIEPVISINPEPIVSQPIVPDVPRNIPISDIAEPIVPDVPRTIPNFNPSEIRTVPQPLYPNPSKPVDIPIEPQIPVSIPTKPEELIKLIALVEKKIKTKDKLLSKIKNPQMLLEALKDLNSIIGMNKLKDSIAIQTMKIITSINKGQTDQGLLNTVLYGSPGVGKTTVALKLAKIYLSLGFLENNAPSSMDKLVGSLSNLSKEDMMTLMAYLSITLSLFMMIWNILTEFMDSRKALILLIVLAIIIIAIYSFYKNKKTSKDGEEKTRELVSVVSRKDLVDIYVGGTAAKTLKLCQDNIGKILFIDEAYSLVEDHMDPYGKEALDTLNLFMSENPKNFAVIFAGYKEKLQNSIFAAQPGLASRCMWHFDCDEYTGEELGQIFLLQLKQTSNLSAGVSEKMVIEYIVSNRHVFVGSGRDTKRLVNFVESVSASKNFENSENTIDMDDIYKGMDLLRENNNNITKKKNPAYVDLFDDFLRGKRDKRDQ